MIADDLFAGAGGCVICGSTVPPESRGVTCSYSCRAKLREQRKTTEWRRPRQYPAELVERVRRLYVDEGMTVAEVQDAIGKGVKVQNVIERHGIPTRPAIKRDQRGSKNSSWRGDDASYGAVHFRLFSTFGPARAYECVDCGEAAQDWSYDYGCPNEREDDRRGCLYSTDLTRYSPRCVPCHQRQDRDRAANGQFVRKEAS